MGVSITGTLVRTGAERATLVRRTYALVTASVVVTMLGAAFGLSQPRVMGAVVAHPIIATLLMIAPLWMAASARDNAPRGLALTFLFTAITGVVISPVLWLYSKGGTDFGLVWQAGGLTLSTFAVLTLYATVSRRDFSAWGSFFIVGVWVLIATSLLNIFFKSAIADLWISGATVLVFSGLLVFDTWRLRNRFGPDDYIPAAVAIYLDLLNIFMAVLNLLGGGRRN